MNWNLEDLRYYVIFSVDTPPGVSAAQFVPRPKTRGLWKLTEEGESDLVPGGKHRKWVADLSHKQFERFQSCANVSPEDETTGGSLTEYGWAPAISFQSEAVYTWDAHLDAYVSPFRPDGVPWTEAEWDSVRALVIERYS